jgi:hypothetical protein
MMRIFTATSSRCRVHDAAWRSIAIALWLVAAGLAAGCAARTNIEPVGAGHIRANGGFGGPIVAAFGTHIPIPYFSAGASYGLNERLDLNGQLHVLSLAYSIAGIDAGATWYPVLNDGAVPTLGLSGRLMMLASFKSGVSDRFRAYPILGSSAAWRIGSGMLYTGFDIAVPFTASDYDTAAARVIFSPLVGYRWNLSSTLRLFTELKWQGANVRTDQLAPEYVHPFGNGAITPFLALEWEM